MKELLADRDTRMLLGAQWIAQLGDGLVQVSFTNALILEPEGTVGRILAVSALTLVPYSVIAPFMGVFVDRWRRRTVLIVSNVARAILLGVLAIVSRVVDGDLPLYLGLLMVLGFGRLFLTTKGALLPAVLHDKHLLRGNALSGGGGMIAALAGGVIGVGAIALVDTSNSFLIGGALYGFAALTARKITHPFGHEVAATEELGRSLSRVWNEMVDGIGQVAHRAGVRLPLIGVFIVRVAAMIAAISAILVIKQHFPDTGDRFGRLSSSALALGTAGVGAFIGALVAPFLGRRFNEPKLMLGGFVLAGVGIMALGGISEIWAVLGLTFFGGLGGFIAKVAVDAQVQHELPDEFRGRAFALYDILYNLATVVAALLLLAAEGTRLRPFLVACGSASLLFAVALGSALSRAGLLSGEPSEVTTVLENQK